jgi:site-specific recombinase XerD
MSAMNDLCLSQDAIERFLDRSWMLGRIPAQAVKGHRSTLESLDAWLRTHRVSTLCTASTSDVRALLQSRQWNTVSRGCETLLGLVTRFYHSLRECHFRGDDPVQMLIEQELAAAALRRDAARPTGAQRVRKLTHDHLRLV